MNIQKEVCDPQEKHLWHNDPQWTQLARDSKKVTEHLVPSNAPICLVFSCTETNSKGFQTRLHSRLSNLPS